MWNDKFRLSCEEDETIQNVKDLSTPTTPHYTLTVDRVKFNEESFVKKMLTTTLNTNNIVVFDKDQKITRVSVDDVFTMWAAERIKKNKIRKTRMIEELMVDENSLVERIKFIKLVREKVLILTGSEEDVVMTMNKHGIKNTKLLDLSVRQLTDEKRKECKTLLAKTREQLKILSNKTEIEMWEEDAVHMKNM